jgi:quinol monooxygenase YgiN
MIIRIVKMTFDQKKVSAFLEIFHSSKQHIRNFKGCSHLELLKDIHSPTIFFTYSHWQNENDLDNYRNSELFKEVWGKTKILFSAKAEAWSMQQEVFLS